MDLPEPFRLLPNYFGTRFNVMRYINLRFTDFLTYLASRRYNNVICQAYVGLLCEAIRLHAAHSEIPVSVPVIYRAFSNHTSSERRWEPVITAVYLDMLKQPMVYHSSPDVSEWIEAKNAIFNNLDQVLQLVHFINAV